MRENKEFNNNVIDREYGDAAIYAAGAVDKPSEPSSISKFNRVFSPARELYREAKKHVFSTMNKHRGMAFNGVLYSDPDLPPHCVSIGLDMAIDSIMDPESGLLDLVNKKSGQIHTAEEFMEVPELLMDIVNSLNIECTTEKSPVNIRNSVQVRTLRIHHGGGIGLHPTQGKPFNADFDADQMVVNIDQANLRHHNRAMDYLTDIEGNPAIDMDFFPIDEINERFNPNVESLIGDLKYWFFKPNDDGTSPIPGVDPQVLADDIGKAYYDLCEEYRIASTMLRIGSITSGEFEIRLNRAMVAFLKSIDSVAKKHQNPSAGIYKNQISSYVFKELYDFSCLRRGISIKTQIIDIVENDVFLQIEDEQPSHPLVLALVDEVNKVVAGRPPMNTVEFGDFMNKEYGSVVVKGSNIPFRLVADFCKAIHRTDLINIGDPVYGIDAEEFKNLGPNDPVPFNTVYAITCAAAETKILANRVYFGSHELAVSTQVRERVIVALSKVKNADGSQAFPKGLPNYDGCENQQQKDARFRTWLAYFVDIYNHNTRLINASQVEWRNGMTIANRPKLSFDGIEDIVEDVAKPLVEVFGDFTVSRIFGYDYTLAGSSRQKNLSTANSLWIGFEEMPLRKFSQMNRLKFTGENGKNKIRDHAKKNELTVRDVLMLVADRRTAQLGRFSSDWLDATKENVGLIASVAKHRNARDFDKYLEEVLGIFSIMSTDMFSFFGIDSVSTFLKSKYGNMLLEASSRNDVESVRSTLVTMMVEYRLHRSSKLIESIRESESEIAECSNESINAKKAVLEKEYDKLRESSFVWDAIISDVMKGAEHSTFRRLLMTDDLKEVGKNFGVTRFYAEKFWNSEESRKYATILTFLKSSEPYTLKMQVLADVVRINASHRDLTDKDMIGMLAYDPDSVRDGSSFELDLGIKKQIDNVKASMDKVSSFKNRAPDEIAKENHEFISAIRKDVAGFSTWLHRMATEPGFAVHVPPVIAGDAIASVFEKNMHDTEKIQQQAQVNGLFEDVSIQINGGFFTHLQQTDNKVVNVVGHDQLTFLDLVKVLGDPNIEIFVYDRFGTMIKEPMCRRTLCGGNSIEDVVNYLEQNPRIACMLRQYVVGVNADVDGTSCVNRFKYGSDVDNSVYRVWGQLTDRPEFYASVSLFTKSQGDVGRNISTRASFGIEWMCSMIADMVWDKRNGIDIEFDTEIDKRLGLSKDRIKELLMENEVEGIGFNDDDLAKFEDDADAIYKMVHDELVDAAVLIESSDIQLDYDDIAYYKAKAEHGGFEPTMDRISVKACPDVLQQIGGSRTAKMLPIEGADTKKNIALKIWARSLTDRFGMGRTYDSPTLHPIELGLDEYRYDDTFTSNPHRQLPSVAKFLEIKREKAAETFNSKTKKYGNDGKHSIVKFLKYDLKSIARGKWVRNKVENAGNRNEAVRYLAQELMRADREMGYVDVGTTFKMSDYYNRADVMIGENSDGTFVIRTLEQISAALNSRLSDDVIFGLEDVSSEDAKRFQTHQLAVMDEIVRDLGTDRDPMYRNDSSIMYDGLIDMPIHGTTSSIRRADRAMRSRASSVERNYALNYTLAKSLSDALTRKRNRGFRFPSRKVIEQRARNVFHSMQKDPDFKNADKLLKGIGYPSDVFVMDEKTGKGKWVDGTDFSKTYDLLGTSKDIPTADVFVPGGQSLFVFSKSQDENRLLFERCKENCVTVCFLNDPIVDEEYRGDLVPIVTESGTLWVLPFFDIALNGGLSSPISPAPSQYKANPSNYVTSVKDTTGEFGPGDAAYTACKELLDRAKFAFFGKKPEIFQVMDLFKNTMNNKEFEGCKIEICMCDKAEVKRYIINGEGATVDVGVLEKDIKAFENAWRRYEMRLKEYKKRFEAEADDESFLTGDCRHDSLVGFVKLKIYTKDGIKTVFAPIMPFPPDRSGNRPNYFKCIKPRIDIDQGAFALDWEYSGSIVDQIIKIFEGIGASNKFMVGRKLAKSRKLKSGWSIDGFYYHKAVASRLFASNERIHTMISLWTTAKLDKQFAYNFALLPGAFPDNPEIKQKLANNELTREDWKRYVENNEIGRYYITNDEDGETINSFVKHLVEKAVDFGTVNPSILLCSRTEDALLEPWMTDFEAFLNSSYAFEDAFLLFFHTMQPRLCPKGIEGDSSGCLFKPETRRSDANDPYGTLLCLVPHYLPDGTEYDAPEAVFISPSFFGEEYSDIKNTQINAKNRLIDSLNVAAELTPRDQSMLLQYARMSSMSSVPAGTGYMTMAEDALTAYNEEIENAFNSSRATMLRGLDFIPVADTDTHKRVLGPEYGNVLVLTGHRPKDLKWKDDDPRWQEVYNQVLAYCKENDIDTIVSGMALGFDQIGAKVALDNGLNLVAAVPCLGQEARWKDKNVAEYYDILDQADAIYLVNEGDYAGWKMQTRNEWMVDNGDFILALHDPAKDSGGTYNCISYAKENGRIVQEINPKKIVITQRHEKKEVKKSPQQPENDVSVVPINDAMEKFFDEQGIVGDERRFYRADAYIFYSLDKEERDKFESELLSLKILPMKYQAEILETLVKDKESFDLAELTSEMHSLLKDKTDKMLSEDPGLKQLLSS